MNDLKPLLGTMRLPFLILAPACALVGLGTAIWSAGSVDPFHAILAFLGALTAHISVNVLNEYFDFRSKLDERTQRTPFSGGSGTLQARPDLAPKTLALGVGALLVTGLIGVYFLTVWGLALLPLGLLGLFVIAAYTPWLAHNALASLIAPGLGFGTLAVMGTHFALTGEYSWTAFIASLVPFFLVNDLLLLNQFPDVEADRSIGRRNLPIVYGVRTSSLIYGAFLLLAYLSIVLGIALTLLPPLALLGLGTLVMAVPAARTAYRHGEDMPQLAPALGQNVLINILTPVLLGVGLLLS